MNHFMREITPPDQLEHRVIRALKARALLRRSVASRLGSAAMVAAAGLLLFAGGFAAGASQSRVGMPMGGGGPRFVLLLHETAATASSGVAEHVLVDEYRAWARTVGAGGHAIHGEKLKEEPGDTLSGFFVIEAPSLDAARAIAASCPHVRYGGRIDIREIEPT
jgi:hypothetical protein